MEQWKLRVLLVRQVPVQRLQCASNDPNVDPVGACVGINGARVNAIVSDLRGEKIDIIEWNDDPAVLIENALSPSNVISVEV